MDEGNQNTVALQNVGEKSHVELAALERAGNALVITGVEPV